MHLLLSVLILHCARIVVLVVRAVVISNVLDAGMGGVLLQNGMVADIIEVGVVDGCVGGIWD